jgi:hypothetical protein
MISSITTSKRFIPKYAVDKVTGILYLPKLTELYDKGVQELRDLKIAKV